MAYTLLKNISHLYCVTHQNEKCRKGQEMATPKVLTNAFVLIEQDKIRDLGEMKDLEFQPSPEDIIISCRYKFVLPGFVDSHTHLIFPKTREEEFAFKIQGMSYEEIARRGGGILNSANSLAKIPFENLLEQSFFRLKEIEKMGTTTVEIKSGYGLDIQGEMKMLRVAKELKMQTRQTIKTTFLGAHAIPLEYKDKREKYIDLICEDILPQVAEENLADFIDVFCENIAFTPAETEKILLAGEKYHLPAKIHANQLGYSGGVQVGVKHNAVSVDHLEHCGEAEIECLRNSQTVPTLLPSCSFFLREPYGPARKLIDANLPLCLATDYNPGSSPSGNMNFVMSLACIYLRMTPEEALTACTINGANALQLSHLVGSIEVGKKADLIITKPIENLSRLAYSFGNSLIDKVIVGGQESKYHFPELIFD